MLKLWLFQSLAAIVMDLDLYKQKILIYSNFPIFKIFTHFRNYGYLKFGCCIFAGQNAIIRDRNKYA